MGEIVRPIAKKINKPKKELLFASHNQHVWFYQYVTTISDGRDLNRVFLEAKGSLASRFLIIFN
jgi:hypothetical protein